MQTYYNHLPPSLVFDTTLATPEKAERAGVFDPPPRLSITVPDHRVEWNLNGCPDPCTATEAVYGPFPPREMPILAPEVVAWCDDHLGPWHLEAFSEAMGEIILQISQSEKGSLQGDRRLIAVKKKARVVFAHKRDAVAFTLRWV